MNLLPRWLMAVPSPIRFAVAGVAAATFLVVAAIALRSPPADDSDDVADAGAPIAKAAIVDTSAPVDAGSAPALPDASAPSASAPPASAPPASLAAAVSSGDTREVRTLFSKDVENGRYKNATADLARLCVLDPRAAADGATREDILELAMRVTLLEGDEPDAVFRIISEKMDTIGADILYELLTTRGGSRAAKRAEDLLKLDAVRARGTPAMRVAYDLRVTNRCEDKMALFDRAKKDGDGRTLGQLQMLNHTCGRRTPGCCLHNDPKLKDAIEALKARLR